MHFQYLFSLGTTIKGDNLSKTSLLPNTIHSPTARVGQEVANILSDIIQSGSGGGGGGGGGGGASLWVLGYQIVARGQFKHNPNMFQTQSKHYPNTVQTCSKHSPNKHCPNRV